MLSNKDELKRALAELRGMADKPIIGGIAHAMANELEREIDLVALNEEGSVEAHTGTEVDLPANLALDLYPEEGYTEENGSIISSRVPAQWPVSNLVLASAGAFATGMKAYLDDAEPLIGLISAETGSSDDALQDARNLVMALGFLHIAETIDNAIISGHHWEFHDLTAAHLLRSSWLDDYPNDISALIGFNEYDHYIEGFRAIDGRSLIQKFDELLEGIFDKYPNVPSTHLFFSGVREIIQSSAEVIGFDADRALEMAGYSEIQPIVDWIHFQNEIKGYEPDSWSEVIEENLAALQRGGSPENIKRGLLHGLRGFSTSFLRPFSLSDMELWRTFSKLTYEKVRKDEDYAKGFSDLYYKPYEVEYGTEFPNPNVFEEIVDLIKEPNESMSFDSADEAHEFYLNLISLEWTTLNRHHYPSLNEMNKASIRWGRYLAHANKLKANELLKSEAIRSGSYLNEINDLVGLNEIKSNLLSLAKLVSLQPDQKLLPPLQHIIFSGNPGTGKTTVAQLLGKIYATLGMLSSGHVVSVTRADLVAEYTGQTAPKVKTAIDKAMGGILFIDEAYTLKRNLLGDSDNFGQEAIDALLTSMEDSRGKFIIVAAGYPAEMDQFIDSNPGLKSRFGETWQFDDYSEEDLWGIAVGFLHTYEVEPSDDLRSSFEALSSKAKKIKNFSNARWVRNTIEASIRRRASRMSASASEDEHLLPLDLEEPILKASISTDVISGIQTKLNSLVGLTEVKDDILDLISMQQLQMRRSAQGMPPLANTQGHLVFSGPPGTGKTTVARLIGQIYKELGVLKSGHVVETQRADLVAGFIGQTAIKTESLVNKSIGGVLFIDEAYTLNRDSIPGAAQDYGQEAIDTLLKLMEDRKGEFIVIVAGYSQPMNKFLKSNPGLESRFSKTLNFLPWGLEEFCVAISTNLSAYSLTLEDSAMNSLQEIVAAKVNNADFASGRTARTLTEKLIEAQARRLSSDLEADMTKITTDDLSLACSRLWP